MQGIVQRRVSIDCLLGQDGREGGVGGEVGEQEVEGWQVAVCGGVVQGVVEGGGVEGWGVVGQVFLELGQVALAGELEDVLV